MMLFKQTVYAIFNDIAKPVVTFEPEIRKISRFYYEWRVYEYSP